MHILRLTRKVSLLVCLQYIYVRFTGKYVDNCLKYKMFKKKQTERNTKGCGKFPKCKPNCFENNRIKKVQWLEWNEPKCYDVKNVRWLERNICNIQKQTFEVKWKVLTVSG